MADLPLRYRALSSQLQYRLERSLKAPAYSEGLLVAFLNIDEVIEIIRHEDEPETGADVAPTSARPGQEAILELKLRHLAKLEEMKIPRRAERGWKRARQPLQAIPASERKMNNLLEERAAGRRRRLLATIAVRRCASAKAKAMSSERYAAVWSR